MKKLTILISIILTANLLSAQWIQQNLNYTEEGWCGDIFFIDQYHGWVVGAGNNEGLCFKTATSGANWEQIEEVTGHLVGVYFYDQNNGWILETGGKLWHWDNHDGIGFDWVQHLFVSQYHYPSGLSFTDTVTGYISYTTGGFNNGGVVKTIDGGLNNTVLFTTGAMLDVFFNNELSGWIAGSYSSSKNSLISLIIDQI